MARAGPINPSVKTLDVDFFTAYNFQEQRVLGMGISGSVVLATSINNSKVQRAVKMFSLNSGTSNAVDTLEQQQDDKASRMFMREVAILTKFRHPHLMRMFCAVRCPGYLAIVMPFCKNGALDRHIADLNWQLARQYFKHVTSAVDFLHSRKVIHGDIKTQNILINEENSAILTDFGFSKMLPNHQVEIIVNFGTPAYMAPECSEDERVSPYKTDMYALGVVLWSIIMRKRPRRGYKFLQDVDSSTIMISSNIRYLLKGLLREDPYLRLTASEVLEDL